MIKAASENKEIKKVINTGFFLYLSNTTPVYHAGNINFGKDLVDWNIIKLNTSIMKTLLFIIFGIIVGAIAMWVYQQYGKENGPIKKSYKSFSFTKSELKALEEDKGGDPISPNEAIAMRRVSGLSTTSVWFSADTLDKYFSKWAAFNEATGIRVYLAKYDSNNYYANRNNPDKMDLRGQYTVFFVPTRDSVSTVGGAKQTFRVDISEKFAYPVNRGYSCPPYPDSICKGQSYQ